ncbi:condensin complex subunit 2 isoform X2 [Heptranchias perlo]|uniref:condensin complex subunit 2 isoform X2 n=1 Tax=Heptranchias perlo TaxID=212740 RepID=UPI0035594CBD
MNTSTPESRVDSADHIFISPATKRQAIQSIRTSIKMDVAANDDEREKRERRRSKVTDLQLSGIESPLESPVQRGTPQSFEAKLSNNQISEHYSTCIKLCSENKITTKNAFGLHLIDYMADLLKEKESELTNFKMAAGTLDASAKIYAVRVDAVHSDVFRVLGGLGKNSEEQGAEVNPGSSEENAKGSQKQHKKKHSYKTIEQNLSNITYGARDMKCEIDPMFQKAASLFDECSTVGVFMVNLQMYGHSAQLLFDSDVKLIQTGPAPELPPIGHVEISDLGALQQSLEDKTICPTFEDFQFAKWDSEAHNQAISSMMEKFKKSNHLFDMNAEPEFADNQLGGSDAPVDDFDGDICDDDAGDLVGQDFNDQQEASCQGGKEVIPLTDVDFNSLCVQLSNQPGEYSYFSPRIMKMWAGPNHWHFKARHKAEAITDKDKKKQAKKTLEIAFNEKTNFETHFRETRAATTISKAALDRHSRKLTTLPTDFYYDPDNINRLFLKPSVMVKRIVKRNVCSDQDERIGEYDYNNPNDTSNFCPRAQIDSDDEHDGFVAANDSFEITADAAMEQENGLELVGKGLNITTYGGENLVAEPQKVNKILLNYSKTAKKMDVKRLKQNMWDLLIGNTHVPGGKNRVAEELEVNAMTVKGQQSFTTITKNLFERLPSTMAKNLSVPMAFACLLHLANEKNLEIEGKKDLSDVVIKQGI